VVETTRHNGSQTVTDTESVGLVLADVPPTGELATLAALGEQARAYLDAARSANTHRAYRSDWAAFTGWCHARDLTPLPASPTTLALYLTDQARALKTSTLQRRLVAIAQTHRAAGQPSPTEDAGVRAVWRGIRRTVGTAQVGKAALLTDDIRQLVEALAETTAGMRDRALLLLGFAGAFRRSELVALDVTDVQLVSEGAVVTIRRSKTDQEGIGERIGIPRGRQAETCPVGALRTWLEMLGRERRTSQGPLFRAVDRNGNIRSTRLSACDVARIVKRVAERAGLDPTEYAGHSLRAGLATSAAIAGVEERAIMAQTRHKSVAVARRYIRDGSLFRGNAAGLVGL
jgi:site-specific recombinase XerD